MKSRNSILKIKISVFFIICISLFPSLGATEEAYMLKCHKITGECFSLDKETDTTLEFFGDRKLDEYETIFLNVKPVMKIKQGPLTKEEGDKQVPSQEALLMLMLSQDWAGLKFFRQVEKYPNGQIKAEYTGYGTSKDLIGWWHGEYIQWYENGQKKVEVSYVAGCKDGKFTRYDNGTKMGEGYYKQDKLQGVTKIYDTKGNLRYVDTYENGEKKNRKAYDAEGKLKFDQDY